MPCMALVWPKRGKTSNSVFRHRRINLWQRLLYDPSIYQAGPKQWLIQQI